MSKLAEELTNLEQPPETTKVDIKTLTCESGYRILTARSTSTKYGQAIALDISIEDGQPHLVFLPKRYTDQLTDEDVMEISTGSYKITCTDSSGQSPAIKIWKN